MLHDIWHDMLHDTWHDMPHDTWYDMLHEIWHDIVTWNMAWYATWNMTWYATWYMIWYSYMKYDMICYMKYDMICYMKYDMIHDIVTTTWNVTLHGNKPKMKLYWSSWPLRIFLFNVFPASTLTSHWNPSNFIFSPTYKHDDKRVKWNTKHSIVIIV